MTSLREKVVVVTGASSGIGRAVAEECAARGARVVLIARSASALHEVCAGITNSGGQAHAYALDLRDADATASVCAEVLRTHGAPDVLVNNAGVGAWRTVEDTTPEQLEAVMQVPVMAAFRVVQAFLPAMKARTSGRIVTMTSFAAFIAFPGAAAYLVSRHAMRALHLVLREETWGSGVKCSLAFFSKVDSEYWQHNPESEQRLPRSHRLIRTLTPVDAARAICRGLERGREYIYAPASLWWFRIAVHWLPGVMQVVLRATTRRGTHGPT
jgi:short-subunit dehydrogenase